MSGKWSRVSLGLAVPALAAYGATAWSSVLDRGGWQVAERVTGLGDQAYVWAVTAAEPGSEWAFGDYGNQGRPRSRVVR